MPIKRLVRGLRSRPADRYGPEPGGDNPGPGPRRLFGVAEGSARGNESAPHDADGWEREVREVLADRVAGVRPSGVDLAGAAIASGRRKRRVRNLTGAVAVLGAVIIATGALLFDWRGSAGAEYGPVTGLLGDPVTASPIPSDEPARLAYDRRLAADLSVEVVGDGTTGGMVLATEEGKAVDLAPIRQAVSVHRTGEGWAVISGGNGTHRLWWVTAEGKPESLLAGMDAIVVSQGQVAWQRGSAMFAATLSGDGELRERVSTAAPEGAGEPVGFVGEAVLLERPGPRAWDTWQPSGGEYRPGWTREVVRVYGTPAGQAAIGLVDAGSGAGEACVARLDPGRGLAVAQTGCPAGSLSATGPAAVSPQGRWLLATDGEDRTGVLVDLAAAFEPDPAAITEVTEVAAPASEPVWVDANAVLFLTADQVVKLWPERLRTGAEDAIEVVDRSGAALVMVEPV